MTLPFARGLMSPPKDTVERDATDEDRVKAHHESLMRQLAALFPDEETL